MSEIAVFGYLEALVDGHGYEPRTDPTTGNKIAVALQDTPAVGDPNDRPDIARGLGMFANPRYLWGSPGIYEVRAATPLRHRGKELIADSTPHTGLRFYWDGRTVDATGGIGDISILSQWEDGSWFISWVRVPDVHPCLLDGWAYSEPPEATPQPPETLPGSGRTISEAAYDDVVRVSREREEEITLLRAQIDRITERAWKEAEERGWCSEFDQIMTDLGLPGRDHEFEVDVDLRIRIPYTVRVRARTADEAMEAVDGWSEDELREHMIQNGHVEEILARAEKVIDSDWEIESNDATAL